MWAEKIGCSRQCNATEVIRSTPNGVVNGNVPTFGLCIRHDPIRNVKIPISDNDSTAPAYTCRTQLLDHTSPTNYQPRLLRFLDMSPTISLELTDRLTTGHTWRCCRNDDHASHVRGAHACGDFTIQRGSAIWEDGESGVGTQRNDKRVESMSSSSRSLCSELPADSLTSIRRHFFWASQIRKRPFSADIDAHLSWSGRLLVHSKAVPALATQEIEDFARRHTNLLEIAVTCRLFRGLLAGCSIGTFSHALRHSRDLLI